MDEGAGRPAAEATDEPSGEVTTGPAAEDVGTPASGAPASEDVGAPASGAPARPKTQSRHVVRGFVAVLFSGFLLAPLLSVLFQ